MNNNQASVSFYVHKSNWKNSNIFPDIVYIDTNVIRDIFEQRKNGKLMEDYLLELNNRNGMIIWSEEVTDELIDFLNVDEYKKLAIQKGLDENDFKLAENTATESEYKRIGQNIYYRLEIIEQYLSQFGMKTDNDRNDVFKYARILHKHFGGNRKDAHQVADAMLSGVNNILTQDGGFLRYPNLNVYGASKKIRLNYNPNNQPVEFLDISSITNIKKTGKELNSDDISEDAS